jgi:glucose-1-phosphate thymidylyltransferase
VKGVVLAGGTGSRLFPLTKITNKHLLPIYDKPMIYYPIQTLVDADALALAEHFADGQKICVVLGDNIIQGNVREAVEEFKQQPTGAKILLKEVPDAERFGVAEIRDGRIASIEEKPKHPKSNYAVIGIYMYDETVFEKVRVLVPSGRGELEITDVNNAYIREGSMSYGHLDGWWTDAGTFESLLRAANLVAETRTKNSEAVLVKP